MKPISCGKQPRSLRESPVICNSSLWSPAAPLPLKYMKHPCILMINSSFGLASSCILLLVAMRRILTHSREGSEKGVGGCVLEAWKGQEAGKVQGLRYLPRVRNITCVTWAISGVHEVTEALQMSPEGGAGGQRRGGFLLQEFCWGLAC